MKSLVLRIIRTCGILWCRLQGAQVHPGALIHGFPRIVIKPGGAVIIGPRVTLNAASWSNPFNDGRRTVLFAGPGALIELEEGCGLSSSRIIAHKSIRVGRDSMIGAGCLITDSDMHEIPLGSGNPVGVQAIRIGERVFLGAHCIVLKGVSVGDGTVVGAGSVVTRTLPAGVLAGGAAAAVRRPLG